ncbi:MAG: DUF5050 domain-containing protein [Minisyncoccia bacterium]
MWKAQSAYVSAFTALIFLLVPALALASAFPGSNGKIVFQSDRDGNSEIYAMEQDGSAQTNLTNNSDTDSNATWSPDGAKITFTSTRDGNNEVYIMNADGSGQTRLTAEPGTDYFSSFSHDGTKIVFASDRDGNTEIYVMNADGTGATRLTTDGSLDYAPTWSPDGTKIAFTSTRDGSEDVYVMNADGSGQTNLSNNGATDEQPSWSPDGTKLVFNTNRDGDWEVFSMNADGSSQTNVTANTVTDFYQAYSPDGAQITFGSHRDGNYEIYIMNADGSGQTNLTNDSSGGDLYPNWQPIVEVCIAVPPWFCKAPLLEASQNANLGHFDGKIYASHGNPQSDSLQVYDIANDLWSFGADTSTPLLQSFGDFIGDKLYLAGGCNGSCGSPQTTLQIYDATNDTWGSGASMPTARGDGVAVTMNGKLYVAGGNVDGSGGATDVLEIYDPVTDSWTTGASIPTGRFGAAGAIVGGKWYVVGGHSTGFGYPASVDVYDPVTDSWSTVTSLPGGGRVTAGVASLNGKLHVIGGGSQSAGGAVDTHDVYDPTTDSWSTDAPLPIPYAISAITVGSTIYQISASDDQGASHTDVFAFVGEAPETATLTTTGDSFLRHGNPDRNEGANPQLRIQASGDNRVVVKFDEAAIDAFVAGGFTKATLVLTIGENADNWGTQNDRTVDAHLLSVDFAEGNGQNAGVPGSQSTRGTGAGTTWDCASDTNIANQQTNCSPQWNGGTFGAATAPSQLHVNNQTGEVEWDVTQDVLSGAFGWLIKKTNEGRSGHVDYYSREGATTEGNANLAPRLILE